MWSHFSKAPCNQKGWWYVLPKDPIKFFNDFLSKENFNLHEAVPEYDKFKFFIDYDYYGTIDVYSVKKQLDEEIGSTSLMATNIRPEKTGIHLIYPEIHVTVVEAIKLVKKLHNPYIDPIPYSRSIRTIYSSKDYGETDYYVPEDGGRDAETMIRYSIFILQSPS
jgi:hypothetical protein